jgi:hypothetical protein
VPELKRTPGTESSLASRFERFQQRFNQPKNFEQAVDALCLIIYAGANAWILAGMLSRNDAVAVARSCDAPSQKVGATPSSRDKPNPPFGWAAGVGDEASPAPSATGRRSYAYRRSIFQQHRSG